MKNQTNLNKANTGIIQKRLFEVHTHSVNPYEDDIEDIEKAKRYSKWIDIETLKKKIHK